MCGTSADVVVADAMLNNPSAVQDLVEQEDRRSMTVRAIKQSRSWVDRSFKNPQSGASVFVEGVDREDQGVGFTEEKANRRRGGERSDGWMGSFIRNTDTATERKSAGNKDG
jgi:hypothetical protein